MGAHREEQLQHSQGDEQKARQADLILVPGQSISPWEALGESQRLMASELADTQHQVGQLFAVLEQAVMLLTESVRRPGPGGSDAAIAAGVARRLLDLQGEMQALREAVSGSRVEETVGNRVRGLFDALKDELDHGSKEQERSLRREIDRLLWILLGAAGAILGGVLWMFLKP